MTNNQVLLQDAQDVACAIATGFECEDAPMDCATYRGGLCLSCLIRNALRDQTPPKAPDPAWSQRLDAIREKHERTGGPDEQELADMGRT